MQFDINGRTAWAYTGGKAFDATQPCVVFIHGALHDHSVWTLLARWAAHHGQSVLAVDLPGHGRSQGPALASVEALAAWCMALLDAAGVAQAAWVGHSMGSLIALEAAGQAPERARRVVMLGTAFPMKVSDALLSTARDHPLKAIDMVNAFSFSSIAAKPSFPAPGAWLHGGNRALMRRVQAACTDTNLLLEDFQACNAYARGIEAAQRVSCPTTIVAGALDQMTPAKAADGLAAALRARRVTLPCGHAMMQERPDEVLAALREALA